MWGEKMEVREFLPGRPWWSSGWEYTLPIQGPWGSNPGWRTKSHMQQLRVHMPQLRPNTVKLIILFKNYPIKKEYFCLPLPPSGDKGHHYDGGHAIYPCHSWVSSLLPAPGSSSPIHCLGDLTMAPKDMHMHAKSLQLCPTLCNPMDYSPSGSSVHGILLARILEWVVAVPSSRGSFWPRDRTCISHISCIGRQVLYH